MKRIFVKTCYKKLVGDMYTLPGIYLRLRDRFRDVISFESKSKFSFIGINPVAEIKISGVSDIEYRLPLQENKKICIGDNKQLQKNLDDFIQCFDFGAVNQAPVKNAQSLFGYITYNAVQLFNNNIEQKNHFDKKDEIPLMYYRLYQYVIIINNLNNELFICENKIEGIKGELDLIESIVKNRDIPLYPFKSSNLEKTDFSGNEYDEILSKQYFRQQFCGDEFNVYRALRNTSSASYLFYFDYGSYKILGSSPAYNLIAQKKAVVEYAAIRGLEGKPTTDRKQHTKYNVLQNKLCNQFAIDEETRYTGNEISLETNPFKILTEALNSMLSYSTITSTNEPNYNGAIGLLGFDGSYNHTTMVYAFLSKDYILSNHIDNLVNTCGNLQGELQEISNKLYTLKNAIALAEEIG